MPAPKRKKPAGNPVDWLMDRWNGQIEKSRDALPPKKKKPAAPKPRPVSKASKAKPRRG